MKPIQNNGVTGEKTVNTQNDPNKKTQESIEQSGLTTMLIRVLQSETDFTNESRYNLRRIGWKMIRARYILRAQNFPAS